MTRRLNNSIKPDLTGDPSYITTPIPSINKTKKIKAVDKVDKKALWDCFDNNENKPKIDCVFRKQGERELCDCCQSSLAFSDEGFLCCTNDKCGIIYTDAIDQGAEWRFYGADDNQSEIQPGAVCQLIHY